jgi:hypothetical protein
VAPIADEAVVHPRPDATVDGSIVRVEADSAVKQNIFPSWSGHPSGRAHWETRLRVEAWVHPDARAGETQVWADVHVFGHDAALVARDTCYLTPDGEHFRLDCVAYEGATATPGSAQPRPDVRLVQYRIYVAGAGQTWTDGRLHECLLKADVVSV